MKVYFLDNSGVNPPPAKTIMKKIQKIDNIRNLPDFKSTVELSKDQLTDLIKKFPKFSTRKASNTI